MSTQNVVIAIDGSEQSMHAFEWYLENSYRDGDYVYALMVSEGVHLSCIDIKNPVAFPSAQWQEKLNHQIEHAKKIGNHIESTLQAKRISGGFIVESGNPGQTICEFAKKKDARVIVIGCRGLGTIRRTIIGSVSSDVVHHADRPVTVVPKP